MPAGALSFMEEEEEVKEEGGRRLILPWERRRMGSC